MNSQQKDLYLECGSGKDRDFYLKFGYDVVGEHEIEDPSGSEKPLEIYCMMRKFQTKL